MKKAPYNTRECLCARSLSPGRLPLKPLHRETGGASLLRFVFSSMSTSSSPIPPETLFLLPEHTMDFAGRQTLGFYLAHLRHHEERLRAFWDVEALHDMRVASRRLRVACRLFRGVFPHKALEPFRSQLRILGGLLGAVRDLDVFIEFVEEYGKACGEAPGIIALLGRLETERETPRVALERHLAHPNHYRFEKDFADWLYGEAPSQGSPVKKGLQRVRDVAPIFLEECRKAVPAFAPAIADQPSAATLHTLRIACKGLRYTAEFFRSSYDKRLNPMIKQATELQDILGRHHDADVHIAYLTRFIAGLDRRSSRQRRIQADLEAIIFSERQAQQASHTTFLTLWQSNAQLFTTFDFALRTEQELSEVS